MRKTGLLLAFVLLLALNSISVNAQDASNLLINGGLEEDAFGSYSGRRGGEFPIYLPNGWNYWFAGQTGDRYNRGDKATIQPHPGPGPNPREGRRALNVNCGFYTCTAAVYQQVGNLTPNANVQASAYAMVKACNLAKDSKGNIIAPDCGSAIESGAQVRIGIDPNGGTDPSDSDIVWSGFIAPHEQGGYQLVSVSATTTGSAVTLFLYSTQSSFADLNKTYWDQVTLSGGGAGGSVPSAATAVPTAPPVVPFVVPQGEQPDGSVVHTVQSGDTIDSIAFAYGIPRATIMELNGINDPRIIQIGQKLLIKAAAAAEPASSDSTPALATDAQPASPQSTEELQATVQPVGEQPTAEQPSETQPTNPPPAQIEATAQPTQPLPTAPVVVANSSSLDPASTSASVCIILFNDLDQNRIQEQGEDLLKGGSVSLLNGEANAGSYETDGISEPHCFADLAAGDYMAVATAPDGFGLTTPNQLNLRVNPGTTIHVVFGAAEGVQALQAPPPDEVNLGNSVVEESVPQRSIGDQLLSISGVIIFGLAAVVMVGGIGVALFLRRR